MENQKNELIKKYEDFIVELDYDKASWIHKHIVIDLRDKCKLIVKSLVTFEGKELQEVISTAQDMTADIENFINDLNNKKV